MKCEHCNSKNIVMSNSMFHHRGIYVTCRKCHRYFYIAIPDHIPQEQHEKYREKLSRKP